MSVIHLSIGKQKKKKKTWATIGEQLRKLETLPKPLQIIASPTLTGALVGTLSLLTGTSPITAAIAGTSIPVIAGVTKTSPTIDEAISKRITDPIGAGEQLGSGVEKVAGAVGKAGEAIGGAVEKGKSIIEKTKEIISSKPITSTLVAGGLGAAGIAAISKLTSALKDKSLSLQTPLIGAPSFIGGEPTAPAAIQIPTQKAAIEEKTAPAMKISQKVDIKINNKAIGKRTSKKYIKEVNYIG